MARARREFVPGGIYHVYARGSNRQAIFVYDTDRLDFLRCLARVVENGEQRCLGYCLMSNHYHLLLETPAGGLSDAIKARPGRYALRFNRRHARDAHLFRIRFGAVLQESEPQFLATFRYTARNPVEKGLCREPEEWPWSSCRAIVGAEPAPPFLDVSAVLSYFGDEARAAAGRYRELVSDLAPSVGV